MHVSPATNAALQELIAAGARGGRAASAVITSAFVVCCLVRLEGRPGVLYDMRASGF